MNLKIPFLTVEPFVYLCMTGFFLSIVSTPQLILENRCSEKFDDEKCKAMYKGQFKSDYKKVQEDTAIWIAVYKVISNFVTLLALPTIGTLTDVFGSYRAMFLVPLSLVFRSSFMLLVLKDGNAFQTWILLLIGPIPGLVGGFGGLIVFATAYISEITPYEQRTLRITLIDASAVLAGFTATLISGFIIEEFGYFGIYTTVLGLVTLALINWFFFIKPETKRTTTFSRKSVIARAMSSHAFVDSAAAFMLTNSEIRYVNKTRKIDKECSHKSISFADAAGSRITPQYLSRDGMETIVDGEENALDVISYTTDNEHDLDDDVSKFVEDKSDFRDQEKTNAVKILEKVQLNKDSIQQKNNQTDVRLNANQIRDNKEEVKDRRESISTRNRPRFSVKRLKDAANPFKNLSRIRRAVKASKNIRLQVALLVVLALTTFSNTGELNLIMIFLRNEPFYLRPLNVGLVMAFQNGSIAVIGLILFNMIFQRLCRTDDLVMVLVSSTVSIVYFISMALVRSLTVLYLIQILHAICTLSIPAIRAFLSKMSKPSTVGAILGLVSMVETFSSVLACFAAPLSYAKLAQIFPGAVFFIFASFMLIAAIIALVLNIIYARSHRDKIRTITEQNITCESSLQNEEGITDKLRITE